MFEITIPFAPSVNSYWGQRVVKATKGPMAGKYIAVPFLTDKARQFREDVMKLAIGRKCVSSGSAIAVHVMVYPPDRRARDLDNLSKGILDALVHAKILRDDVDIWDLRFTRQSLSSPPGRIVVRIWPINVATIAEIQPGDNLQETAIEKAVRGMQTSAEASEEARALLAKPDSELDVYGSHYLTTRTPEEHQRIGQELAEAMHARSVDMDDVTFDEPKPLSGAPGRRPFRMGNATEHVPRRRSPPAPTQQTSMIDDEKPS